MVTSLLNPYYQSNLSLSIKKGKSLLKGTSWISVSYNSYKNQTFLLLFFLYILIKKKHEQKLKLFSALMGA